MYVVTGSKAPEDRDIGKRRTGERAGAHWVGVTR